MATIFTLSPKQRAIASESASLVQFCYRAGIPYPSDAESLRNLERMYRRAYVETYLETGSN